MYEDTSGGGEPRKNRRPPNSRIRTPRAARSAHNRRKSPTKGFGGVHRRRNKHWNW